MSKSYELEKTNSNSYSLIEKYHYKDDNWEEKFHKRIIIEWNSFLTDSEFELIEKLFKEKYENRMNWYDILEILKKSIIDSKEILFWKKSFDSLWLNYEDSFFNSIENSHLILQDDIQNNKNDIENEREDIFQIRKILNKEYEIQMNTDCLFELKKSKWIITLFEIVNKNIFIKTSDWYKSICKFYEDMNDWNYSSFFNKNLLERNSSFIKENNHESDFIYFAFWKHKNWDQLTWLHTDIFVFKKDENWKIFDSDHLTWFWFWIYLKESESHNSFEEMFIEIEWKKIYINKNWEEVTIKEEIMNT